MFCKVCNNETNYLFKKKVLNLYSVSYYQCSNCSFIQTEDPYWLDKAYESPISILDVGLISRNLYLSKQIGDIILKNFSYKKTFIDFGGGYGMFVRLMRDMGFNFYRNDKYCTNLFSPFFDLEDCQSNEKFECLTAIEVFEHIVDPLEEIKKMFEYSDTIIFTTELIPFKEKELIEDWWYWVPEGGQHISFYSKETFQYIANVFGCKFITNNQIHILTKKLDLDNLFEERKKIIKADSIVVRFLKKIINILKVKEDINNDNLPKLVSLLAQDFEKIKKNISNDSNI